MSARLLFSAAASTVFAAPSTPVRRDKASGDILAFPRSDCKGEPTYNATFQDSFGIQDGKMVCYNVHGSSGINVQGSGCRTYFYTDTRCIQDKFQSYVQSSDCVTGVNSYAIDCSNTALTEPAKAVTVVPGSSSSDLPGGAAPPSPPSLGGATGGAVGPPSPPPGKRDAEALKIVE